jgi:hypothetical protein
VRSFVFQLISLIFLALGTSVSLAVDGLRWGTSSWDHAIILPVGKTVIEVRGQLVQDQSLSSESAGAGVSGQGLGSLSYKQTLGDLLQQSKAGGALLKSAQNQGLDLNQVVSEAFLNVERSYSETQLRWAHSLTPNWMLGFNIPIVSSTTRVDVQTRDSLQNSKLGPQLLAQGEKDKLTIQRFRELISDMDWDDIEEEMNYTGLGNVELLSQVQVWQQRAWLLSIRNRFMIPAGSNNSAYQPIPLGPDDGRMSLGADVLLDWQPRGRFVVTATLGYTALIRDEVEARVPNQSESRWFWEVDPNVTRDLGDHIIGRLSSSARVLRSFWLTGGYEYFQKYSDYYEGSLFDRESYRQLEENTGFSRQAGRIGLRYQPPIQLSAQSDSSYAAGVEYLRIFESKQSPAVDGASLDLQVFF